MSKSFKKDLTGQRFGRLTVLEFVPREGTKQSYWKCQCDCGNIKVIAGNSLSCRRTLSCGCHRIEKITKVKRKYKDGTIDTRLYKIWKGFKQRCYNKNEPSYKNYGGRGISVCNEWKNDFKAFYDWAIENGYSDDLTIDRIDNNGNYEPSNCRWVNMLEQQRNKRNNVMVEYEGKKMCLSAAAKQAGVSVSSVESRYIKGERGKRLFRPAGVENKSVKYLVEYNGEKVSLSRASKLSGIPKTTLFRRYNKGDRGERLFRT